jgi:hypothetical protein
MFDPTWPATLRWQPMARRLGMDEEFLPGFTMPQFGWLLGGLVLAVVCLFWCPEWLLLVKPWVVVFAPVGGLLLPRRIKGRRTVWVNVVSLVAYLRSYRRAVYGGRDCAQYR